MTGHHARNARSEFHDFGDREPICMRNGTKLLTSIGVSLICSVVLPLLASPVHAADPSVSRILSRLEALEADNKALRAEVQQEKAEFDQYKRNAEVSSQNQTVAVAALNQKAAISAQELPTLQGKVDYIAERVGELPVQVGFRTGWSESPYDMPGGYFYSAYLSDRLLTQEDGVPGGYVTGELMAGLVLGNNSLTTANLLSQLQAAFSKPAPFRTYLDTIEIQPTVQYHLDLASVGLARLESIKPYALAGPGIWISTMTTPVVVGKFPLPGAVPGDGYRHTDADVQPGGVFGLGFELALSHLNGGRLQGIVNRTAVGTEWRYNVLANGENYQQYTGSIAFGF